MIGMTILVMYHPYFLGYNILLITGCAFLLTFFRAWRAADYPTGLATTLPNLFTHCRTSVSTGSISNPQTALPLLLKKTDTLVQAYVLARKTRSDILSGAQYQSTVVFQAFIAAA